MTLVDDVEQLREHWRWLKQGGRGLIAEMQSHETSSQLQSRHVADYLEKLEDYIEELTQVVGRIAGEVEGSSD